VLLLGESGTGKELIARAIHEGSARAKKPFVPVECSGLTESLFESELFGHRKGAFTSAHYEKQGLVELAHEGTLFLDEIGEMTPQLQVKLLRLLETQTFRKVGGTDSKYVDFRLVCATNRSLEAMVRKGEFRSDLYYRLSAFPIELPPLRERRDDIELLAVSLLRRSRDKRKLSLSPEALDCLRNYDYPGNIRELQNMLERARILATGDILECEHFPSICTHELRFNSDIRHRTQAEDGFVLQGLHTLEAMEEQYLVYLMERYSGTRAELAKHLGVSLRTLTRKLKGVK
jgi:two-component system response regulator HydG